MTTQEYLFHTCDVIIRETAEECINWKPWKTDELSLDRFFCTLEAVGMLTNDSSEELVHAISMLHFEMMKEVQLDYDVELS